MATVISKLSEKVVNDLFTQYPQMFVTVSKAAYINALQTELNEIVDTDIKLGTINPDYETVMLRLMQALSGIAEWSDLITASTGHAIIRSIATNVAYSQFSIERAYQEAFLASAASDSAVFSGIRSLGVRPQRRQPARTQVQINRQEAIDILTIPAYSVFSIGSMKFFNRQTIVLNRNVFAVTAYLFQGIVMTDTITSDGEPFQSYTVGAGEHNASDLDVAVTIENVVWTKTIDGVHKLGREQLAYNENTAQNGDIELKFGNGDYGKIPPISTAITVQWVKTLGEDANTQTSGLAVTWDNPPSGYNASGTISGTTLTNIEDGAEAISSDVYKIIGPDLYAADNRAVRRADYKAQALRFPGVYDALFLGQAQLAPGRRSMMNVIGYVLLTDTNWTLTDFQNFENRFKQDLGIYQCEFLRITPQPIVMNVVATIYCTPDSDLQSIQDKLTDNLQTLFTPRPNYLGRAMMQTDVTDVLNGRNAEAPDELLEQQVSYVEADASLQDTVPSNYRQYVTLGNVQLTMKYTTRDNTSGRLDISPNQADTTVVD